MSNFWTKVAMWLLPKPVVISDDFDKALDITLELEGRSKLSLNRNDPGNWTGGKIGSGELKGTKFGISAKAYPNLDIKNLTFEAAKAIYLSDYWNKAKCDKFPWPMNAAVFDFAVQSGVSRSLKYVKLYPKFDDFLNARNAFLCKFARANPGNDGVKARVSRLRALLDR